MDNATTQVFQDTATIFFDQRVIEPQGFNSTIISVNVISQSVVGASPSGRERERMLQDSFLVVTFRIVANVVPGDSSSFNFQQVVDDTFNTYSYDFQYRLQAASPFFAGNTQPSINSITEGQTSSAVSLHSRPTTTSSCRLAVLTFSSVALTLASWLV
jgi:hypothetical protein